MTWAIFSVVANEVAPSGCSVYTYAQYAYEPYVRGPFFQLSEQMVDDPNKNGGTHPAYPFLTGHGGANQVAVFGYLGYRAIPDDVIHINPNLPPQVPEIQYRTFYWRGWPLTAWSNYTHTTISRASDVQPLDTADSRFANTTIPVHVGEKANATKHELPVKGPLTVANRQVADKKTVAGDLVQCRPASSPDAFQPGQFPMSVLDGASSTTWQPSSAANMSSVTVSFGEDALSSMVSGFHFNWADAPPVNATVIFHDESLKNPAKALANGESGYKIITSKMIKQSDPYDPSTVDLDKVRQPSGNTTDINLSQPVQASRYATLLVVGNQALGDEPMNGTGATVAQWAIVNGNAS